MILQSLNSLYDRLAADSAYKLAPPRHSLQQISFRLVLTADGRLSDIQSLVSADSRRPRQLLVPGGDKPSGQVTKNSVHKKVQLLRGDVQYLLGMRVVEIGEGDEAERVLRPDEDPFRFEAFREFHLGIREEIDDSAYEAVCHFLEEWEPSGEELEPRWAEVLDRQGVFQLRGGTGYVHERSAVKAWCAHQDQEAGTITQCLVTGIDGPVARLHKPMIKGVRGARPSGAAIASFNDDAYESYGKKQTVNAPVSQAVAFRYTTALNALLVGPMHEKHRQQLGDMTLVYWTDQPSVAEDVLAQFFDSGSQTETVQDEAVRRKLEAFVRSIRLGREVYGELGDDPDATTFYLLGLSPNASRIAVRLFERQSLGDLLHYLRRHHRDIAIDKARRTEPDLPPIWMLLRETARDAKGIPPILAAPLLRAVVTGGRYPDGLYSAVIRRIHADHEVNYARACVIKGYLVRNRNMEIEMSLDPDRLEPAYRLGRLFAALEKTQRDTPGGENLNRTVRDSFYSTASANPVTVFPRILKTYTYHLAKLEGGRKVSRERLVQEILDPLDGFPAHLNLADQGLFALGYYQQMRDFYRKKSKNSSKDTTDTSKEAAE